MSTLDQFRLDGRTALVTGASRGIGRAVARALAEAGADVVGTSRTLEVTGSDVEKEVRSVGRAFTGYACDCSDRKALYAFIEKVRSDVARIDILVLNAGAIIRSASAEHSDEHWDKIIEINLSSQFILAREFGREMLARRDGKIIFMASVLSYQGGLYVPSYSATKGALATLTMALANEWAGQGVNVNAIAPGYVATDLTSALRADPERGARILSRIPAGRWGNPEDLAGAVVYLSSPASDYVHGTVLAVDGGWLAR